MSDSTDLPAERKFVVTEVVEADRPRGITRGHWFRYTIGHGSAPITGVRSGSLKSVTQYAEGFAENHNQRASPGYSPYATRKAQNK